VSLVDKAIQLWTGVPSSRQQPASVAASVAANAQPTNRIYRIGVLVTNLRSSGSNDPWWDAFIQRMREDGWVEHQNFVTVMRRTGGQTESTGALARDLVAEKVDLILVGSTEAALAAREATRTIPIVGAALADPVGIGLIASLAQPGGNVTGVSLQGTDLAGKQLELLKEAVPGLSKVAVLADPANAANAPRIQEAKVVAQALRLELEVVEARQVSELETAFRTIAKSRDGAVLVLADPMFRGLASLIASLAGLYRVPAMYGLKEHVLAGGLISYGANFSDLFRRTADYVDKILRGTKASDLPVEQPRKFELIINLKAAKALGLAIPQSLLLRADEVIQ
jgi:putative tryptophan/tyrosine transport system substrate-binding protein